MVESDGMYADLHYNRRHPNAGQILEDCERFPTNFGMSHNAEGEVDLVDGKQIVESLAHVESVDVVGQPATNSGIWESRNKGRRLNMKKTIKRIIEDAPKGTKGIIGLREQVEEGLLDEESIIDVPVEAAGEDVASVGGAEGEVKAALKTAVAAAFDDPNLDLTATLNAIKTILKAHEDIVGPVGETSEAPTTASDSGTADTSTDTSDSGGDAGASEASTSDADDETGTDEEVKESLKRKLKATTMLAAVGISITETKVKALSNKDLTKDEREELLESWKAPKPSSDTFAGRPSSSPRKFGKGESGTFKESVDNAGGFAKAIK
jgi:hypothetical protein